MGKDSNININLNLETNGFDSKAKSAASSTQKVDKELKQVTKSANKTANELDKVSDKTDKLSRSAKAGKLGLEALKDNLGSIPIIGQTATRALDGIDGSLLSIAKAALPVAGIAGGLAAVGGAALLAYKNSEKLQGSIGRLGAEAADLGTNLPIFESLGDAFAVITDNIADAIHNMNLLNGNALANTKKVLDEITLSQADINRQENIAIEKAKAKGASEEEILKIRQQYAGMRIDTAIDNKTIASDEYTKQNEEYERLYKIREKLMDQQKHFNKNNAMEADSYYNLQNEIDRYTEKIDKQAGVRDQSLKANRQSNEIIEKSAQVYKELGGAINAVEGVRSDRNKGKGATSQKDELETARENLRLLKEKQKILDLTVTSEEDKANKAKSDAQAQLSHLEEILVLERKRGITNTGTLEKIKEIKEFLGEEESTLEKLQAQYEDLLSTQQNLDKVTPDGEKERKRIQDLQAQKSKLEEIFLEQLRVGDSTEETEAAIKRINDELNKTEKKTMTWQEGLTSVLGTMSTLGNIASTIMNSMTDDSLIDIGPYEKAIDEAQKKIDEFNKWKEEQEESESERAKENYEDRLARLDEEIEYAREGNDRMSEIALLQKKEEIEKEMAAEDEKLQQEKAIKEEEKKLQQELAIAEYNKAYAEWQNEVKKAQTQKSQAIANSLLMTAQAIGNVALGVSASFGTLGIPGAIIGASMATGILASVVSGVAGIKSASSALDSIQSSPPSPPAFKYGTAGYQMKQGETILVGEEGPELLTSKDAMNISVRSNAQTRNTLRDTAGMIIENVIFNVRTVLNPEEVYKAINQYKARDSFMYTR